MLLHPNELVSIDRALDVLWPAAPSTNALAVLRIYDPQLRAIRTALRTHDHG